MLPSVWLFPQPLWWSCSVLAVKICFERLLVNSKWSLDTGKLQPTCLLGRFLKMAIHHSSSFKVVLFLKSIQIVQQGLGCLMSWIFYQHVWCPLRHMKTSTCIYQPQWTKAVGWCQVYFGCWKESCLLLWPWPDTVTAHLLFAHVILHRRCALASEMCDWRSSQ